MLEDAPKNPATNTGKSKSMIYDEEKPIKLSNILTHKLSTKLFLFL